MCDITKALVTRGEMARKGGRYCFSCYYGKSKLRKCLFLLARGLRREGPRWYKSSSQRKTEAERQAGHIVSTVRNTDAQPLWFFLLFIQPELPLPQTMGWDHHSGLALPPPLKVSKNTLRGRSLTHHKVCLLDDAKHQVEKGRLAIMLIMIWKRESEGSTFQIFILTTWI